MKFNIIELGSILICILSIFIFTCLYFLPAPYGRHASKKWGVCLPNRLAWVIMESPPIFFFLYVFLQGKHAKETVPLVFLVIWLSHYIYRGLIFPFRMHSNKKMPVVIMLFGLLFNLPNSYLNAKWISEFGQYNLDWLIYPKFIIGISLFYLGYYIHYKSDLILLRLRKPGETGYKIPQGFLYKWICSPNYFGETITWIGFAICTWSLPGLAFAIFTIANLLPRARSHLKWYQSHFEDYHTSRKAFIPYIL